MPPVNDPKTAMAWLALKDRALGASSEGITIADARRPDRPLIYVNEGFERLTGYQAAEVLGRNCKFLQGPDADPDTVSEIRAALTVGRDCQVEILNHHKNGTPFWNRLAITPVKDAKGRVTHFIGIQSDVTARREAEARLVEANAQMRRDLEEAAVIQQAWLPQSLPRVSGYDFAWEFRPCDDLAGDGLNILRLDENHIGLYVLDVTGHGVPAALLSASLNRWLSPMPEQSCLYEPDPGRPSGYRPATPAKVAATLNREFSAGPRTGKYFTLHYGLLDLRDGRYRYVTAGHPPPVRVTADKAELLPLAEGVIMGILPGFEFKEQEVTLVPGDRLLVYTDGAFEAVDADDLEMGEKRLMDALVDLHSRPAAESLKAIVEKVEAWCPGGQPQDDVTLIALDVLPR